MTEKRQKTHAFLTFSVKKAQKHKVFFFRFFHLPSFPVAAKRKKTNVFFTFSAKTAQKHKVFTGFFICLVSFRGFGHSKTMVLLERGC